MIPTLYHVTKRGLSTDLLPPLLVHVVNRDRPRFSDQVGHQTTNASIGNKSFFTKRLHRQTYQNYEQPCQRSQNSEFQSHFSVSKIGRIFPIFFFCEEYLIRRPTYINDFFENSDL